MGPHAQLCALMVKAARNSQQSKVLVLTKTEAKKFWKPSFLKPD
jgi:predicted oxidoreductase (fatty acid repression mutant protein)